MRKLIAGPELRRQAMRRTEVEMAFPETAVPLEDIVSRKVRLTGEREDRFSLEQISADAERRLRVLERL